MKILIVEDDQDLRELIAFAVGDRGYEVQKAEDGRAALEVLDRWDADLILLDMKMPVMDGWCFARELRARGLDRPIVVVTASEVASQVAHEIGAIGFVGKPFRIEELLTAVAGQLPR